TVAGALVVVTGATLHRGGPDRQQRHLAVGCALSPAAPTSRDGLAEALLCWWRRRLALEVGGDTLGVERLARLRPVAEQDHAELVGVVVDPLARLSEARGDLARVDQGRRCLRRRRLAQQVEQVLDGVRLDAEGAGDVRDLGCALGRRHRRLAPRARRAPMRSPRVKATVA